MTGATAQSFAYLSHFPLSEDFGIIPVDLGKGEHKLSGFAANQPFGQLPYIVVRGKMFTVWFPNVVQDEDGFIVYESAP